MAERHRSSQDFRDDESQRSKFRMTVDFHLPGGMNDQVSLHTKRISAMCRLGLIKDLTIKTRLGETSCNSEEKEIPIVKVDTGETHSLNDDSIAFRKSTNTLTINTSEIEERLGEQSGNVNAWQPHLDTAVKNGILTAAVSNLLKPGSAIDAAVGIAQIGTVGYDIVHDQGLLESFINAGAWGAAYAAVSTAAHAIHEREFKLPHASFTGSPALDRLAVLSVLNRRLSVVGVKR